MTTKVMTTYFLILFLFGCTKDSASYDHNKYHEILKVLDDRIKSNEFEFLVTSDEEKPRIKLSKQLFCPEPSIFFSKISAGNMSDRDVLDSLINLEKQLSATCKGNSIKLQSNILNSNGRLLLSLSKEYGSTVYAHLCYVFDTSFWHNENYIKKFSTGVYFQFVFDNKNKIVDTYEIIGDH